MKKIQLQDIGLKEYKDAWETQNKLFRKIIDIKLENRERADQITTPNYFLFTEHPHVYTLGKSGDMNNLLLSEKQLKESEKRQAPIKELAKTITSLYTLRKSQSDYLELIIKKTYSNMYAITGSQIGAKLISFAGGFERLAKFPASTIQLLGAEEALFRHLKTGAKSPKYGILHEHPLVTQARASERGKVARALGDKISIAVKVDFFKGKFIGDKLRKQLEAKFIKK